MLLKVKNEKTLNIEIKTQFWVTDFSSQIVHWSCENSLHMTLIKNVYLACQTVTRSTTHPTQLGK